ncbi:acyl-CoA dehydrogenase [Rhodobacterales bacterium 52_120_T64]|nr:acyl-CoA dehydrogenase [Rhodobacterales bacterium 52_120_T64]
MSYRAPIKEMAFCLNNVLDAGRLSGTDKFAEATTEMTEAILGEAARMSEDVLAPLNVTGDLYPAKLDNGVAKCSPGFDAGYKAISEGGWVGMAGDPEYGGMGLPLALMSCVGEMMSSACLSLALNPLMTQGQIEALEHHASDKIKALYLPKLNSGQWTGTMNLTEAGAGSDVGALRTKAEDNGDGTYEITGQKIFISWGDHDVAENICHLVLARLPDAVAGTRGISLFLVPKFIPDEHGNLGPLNNAVAISFEHKMGLHGSPTAIMEFAGATGWMIGREGGGMAAMFTMMNNARIGVGVQGLSQAEAATQKALQYASERKQGRSPVENGTGIILDHADVRRNIMTMKTLTSTARTIILDAAISTDLSKGLDGEVAQAQAARAAFLTPIAKAFGTDTGCEVAEIGVQVHGGMGYIEETGAAQYYRDVRVTAIYEGTNGIQAMDLVGRKLMDGGVAAFGLLNEVSLTAAAAEAETPDLAALLSGAEMSLNATTHWLVDASMNDRFAGAVPFLRAFALTLGGHYLLKAAMADASRLPLARFHIRQTMQQVDALCSAAREGASVLYALDVDALGA